MEVSVIIVAVIFSLAYSRVRAANDAVKKSKVQDEEIDKLIDKYKAKAQEKANPEAVLTPAPDFTLQDIYQDEYALSNYKDKPVLLFFWTTWCPFCEKELRVLNDMYATLTQDGIEVLSVNVGELPDKVTGYIRQNNVAFRVLLDKDTSVASSYVLLGVPTYVLVDKEGNIVFRDNYFPQKEYKALVLPP
jgi:peroxiredoxin